MLDIFEDMDAIINEFFETVAETAQSLEDYEKQIEEIRNYK